MKTLNISHLYHNLQNQHTYALYYFSSHLSRSQNIKLRKSQIKRRTKNKTLITHPSLAKDEEISKRVKECLHISHIIYSYFAIFFNEKVNVT